MDIHTFTFRYSPTHTQMCVRMCWTSRDILYTIWWYVLIVKATLFILIACTWIILAVLLLLLLISLFHLMIISYDKMCSCITSIKHIHYIYIYIVRCWYLNICFLSATMVMHYSLWLLSRGVYHRCCPAMCIAIISHDQVSQCVINHSLITSKHSLTIINHALTIINYH